MEQVLDKLRQANLRANLRKCYFGESKIDYLGYDITRDGIQSQPKKVDVKLLALTQTVRTNPIAQRATQLRSVIACVYTVSIQNQTTNNVP
jgi:hypothetical protein